jgi:formaldehyde-activating enzyme
MVYGPVQSAVAQAIVSKLAEGVVPQAIIYSDVMFVKATVHPQALDRRLLHRSAFAATKLAIDDAFAEGK